MADATENGYSEDFNGKLRDELLGREIFCTLREAKMLIEARLLESQGVKFERMARLGDEEEEISFFAREL